MENDSFDTPRHQNLCIIVIIICMLDGKIVFTPTASTLMYINHRIWVFRWTIAILTPTVPKLMYNMHFRYSNKICILDTGIVFDILYIYMAPSLCILTIKYAFYMDSNSFDTPRHQKFIMYIFTIEYAFR